LNREGAKNAMLQKDFLRALCFFAVKLSRTKSNREGAKAAKLQKDFLRALRCFAVNLHVLIHVQLW